MKTFVSAVIAIYRWWWEFSLFQTFTICLLFSTSFIVSDSFRWLISLPLNTFLIGKSTMSSDHKEARRISLKNVKGMLNTYRRSAIWSGFSLDRAVGRVTLAEKSRIHVYKYKCRQAPIVHDRNWVQKVTCCYENSNEHMMAKWYRISRLNTTLAELTVTYSAKNTVWNYY